MNIGEVSYWNVRYENELTKMLKFELFDWYCPFDKLYTQITGIIDTKAKHKVLIIGIGKSNIIECLYRNGFRDITAIDISPVLISEMQKKYANFSGVEFFIMDVRELVKFPDQTFTWVIDKACLDALFCGTDYLTSTNLALKEIHRILQNNGILLSVSHASPICRVPVFRSQKWAIDNYKVEASIGEGLMMYQMFKTDNEALINKKVVGDSIVVAKSSRVMSDIDQKMNKGSTTKSGQNAGSITVTANVDSLAELVAESAERDS